jgi:heterotetrameric sarcosine oxidase gamma subunit
VVEARSPIAVDGPEATVSGWLVSGRRSSGDLTLTDMTPLAKVAIRAEPTGPLADALLTYDGAELVTSVVAGEWLVLARAGEQDRLVGWLESWRGDEFASVVDLTHGRALLRLTGRQAIDVLVKECAVDLSDRGCPDGRALRCAMSGLAVDVVRHDLDGLPSYLLHCERSSGQYLFDALLDAGAEFGLDVDGFRPGVSSGF